MKQIHSNAMLVNLRISQWTARKIDKRVAGEVAKNHGVNASVGAYYKSVLLTTDLNGERTSIERIKKLVGDIRGYHYKMTLPWLDTGARVLSATAYFEYMQTMQAYKQGFEMLVETFVYDYPFEREEAKVRLGSLFNEDDYPMPERVATRFGFAMDIMPIPMGSDFRCDLGEEEAARIKAEIEKTTLDTVNASIADVYRRIAGVVDAFVSKLQFADTRFEKSLVTNAEEMVMLLPMLNFTGDATLQKIGDTIKDKLCAKSADTLRNDMVARREAYAAALDLKKDMAVFFGSYQK